EEDKRQKDRHEKDYREEDRCQQTPRDEDGYEAWRDEDRREAERHEEARDEGRGRRAEALTSARRPRPAAGPPSVSRHRRRRRGVRRLGGPEARCGQQQ